MDVDYGYVYILNNNSYCNNIIKIGFTKNNPGQRANQIFSGATGVPEPFNVVFACKVIDYKKTEKIIHRSFKSYRVSNRREFFCLPLDVAEYVVLDVCNEINILNGFSINNPFIDNRMDSAESEPEVEGASFWADINNIFPQECFISSLTKDQENRVLIIYKILGKVYPNSLWSWVDDFRKDRTPEIEIKIWEGIAKAFSKVDSRFSLSTDSAKEVYTLLLMRSGSKKSDVIRNYQPKLFSPKHVSEILDCYELKPIPIVVSRIRQMSYKPN
ncbi:T5orf172 domain [Serratia ficaria]|uniref:GIY-YIG nuclease family protein n=1 Tax=Serratia ficaria TaxID=61651 RepID=UPI002179CBD7|nr:GIY-YIG nuclease family protein [Serratia ficaria]CAI2050907.1 T5orf172 domain [Serratia ficaria]CAI2427944.1 T5orf172 domain [Serratia ficaria]